MDIASAEITKYAANAMLATRISFINEIANLCDILGADINHVRKGIGSDSRIGSKFLYPGTGYGGSCFPKDVKAIIKTAHDNGYELNVIKAVEKANEYQKSVIFSKMSKFFDNNLKNKVIGIWGLSFKPKTDDIREASSLILIEKLLQSGAKVKAYDPAAMHEIMGCGSFTMILSHAVLAVLIVLILLVFAVGGASADPLPLFPSSMCIPDLTGAPLAPPNLEVRALVGHFVSKFGEERGNLYGYTAPAINKVVQSAGRLIRSEKDRGVVVLMDERFGQARYATLLPPEMRPKMLGSREELIAELSLFFDKGKVKALQTTNRSNKR
jgi:hypothetical protein